MKEGSEECSFGAVIKEFDRRLRTLKMIVLLRTSDQDADTFDLLAILDAHLRSVESEVQEVRSMLATEKLAIEEAKKLGDLAHLQAARVQAMQARLPAHLPGDARLAAERAAPLAAAGATSVAERRPFAETSQLGQLESVRSPPPIGPGPGSDELKPRKGASSAVPTLDYLTTDELSSAPAYMRTRLSLEKVNAAVDEVHDTLQRKYELLRTPSRQLAAEQRKQQAAYKQLEVDHPKLKGLLFISEEDLKTARHVKQDQTGKNIMSILRHVQRLKEVSAGGLKCWFVVV